MKKSLILRVNRWALATMAAVLAAVALSGCKRAEVAAPAPAAAGSASTMTQPTCTPEVQVNITKVTVTGSTAVIKMNHKQIMIANRGDAGVRWSLPKGYVFVSNGITFPADKAASQPAGPVASAPAGSSDQYLWCFQTAANGQWGYTIWFTAEGTSTPVWKCDPTIINTAPFVDAADDEVTCTTQ